MLRTKLVGPLLQRCFYIFLQINYKKLRKSQTEAQAEEQKQTTNKSSSPRVYQICIKFISQQIRQLERDIHTRTRTHTDPLPSHKLVLCKTEEAHCGRQSQLQRYINTYEQLYLYLCASTYTSNTSNSID